MGYIYLITNLINNKKYVGKTTQDIEKRWKEHIKDSKKERCEIRPLYRAIRKYGKDNFKIEELEKCNTEALSDREQYWINKLNTYTDGYNATLGGDGKILLDYDEIIRKYLTTHNATEVARVLNCSIDSVYKILRSNDIYIYSASEMVKERTSKKVAQYDKKGNLIKIYNSTKDAERAMGNTQHHIAQVAIGKRKTAYGYIWKYVE